MLEQSKAAGRGRFENVEIHDDAKVVFAEKIEGLHQHLHEGRSFTPLGLFDSVPPRPPHFIERPELEPLVDHLLSQHSSMGLTAFEGMGGVGKTIMAIALCHDSRIRQAFPDGIVWLSFGRESRVSNEERVRQTADVLNAQFRTYNEAVYRSLLKDRAVLVVLDDIWDLASAEPFLPPVGRSRLLYTSRNRDIAAPLGAESYEIGLLKPAQARTFLLRWTNRESTPPEAAILEGVIEECKGLVLALAMIGSRLRGTDWSEPQK